MIASFLKIMCVKPDPMVTAEGSSLCSMIKNNYSTERIVRYIGSNKKVLNDRDKVSSYLSCLYNCFLVNMLVYS